MAAITTSAQVDTIRRNRKASTRPASPLSLIGTDSRGRWVVTDQNGRYGGLFVGRAAAIKFALSENGNDGTAAVQLVA
jgi:hypothetical protein